MKNIKSFVVKYRYPILIGLGLTAVVSSTVVSVRLARNVIELNSLLDITEQAAHNLGVIEALAAEVTKLTTL